MSRYNKNKIFQLKPIENVLQMSYFLYYKVRSEFGISVKSQRELTIANIIKRNNQKSINTICALTISESKIQHFSLFIKIYIQFFAS